MISGRKTNRSSTSRKSSIKRPSNPRPDITANYSTAADEKENFVTDFLKLCTDYEVHPLPKFHIIGAAETFEINSEKSTTHNADQPLSRQKPESELVTVFSLIYDSQVELGAPKNLRCKGCEINLIMLDALVNCAKKFTTITTLKLQRCSINAFGIVQISEILAAESGCSIIDLNLDDNPNFEQNYHLLCAPGNRLLYLSLKLCEINDDGVARIASNLSHHDEPCLPKLIVLNLANNRISEIGAKAIAAMLRTNRSLQSLTLTGNRINDFGAECIIEQLSTFTLTHAEIVAKRRRKLNGLKLCGEKMDDLSGKVLSIESLERAAALGKERNSGAENRAKKKRRASSSRQLLSRSSESSVNRSTPIIVQPFEEIAEAIIPADNHPLVKDIIPVDGAFICLGNFKILHLNLSFNKIGEDTLRRVIECVEKQRQTLVDDVKKGLQYVNVEGNEFDETCDLALQLSATMYQRRNSK